MKHAKKSLIRFVLTYKKSKGKSKIKNLRKLLITARLAYIKIFE